MTILYKDDILQYIISYNLKIFIMENLEKLFCYNSVEQNELLVCYFLKHSKLDTVKQLVQEDVVMLTPFILNAMITFGYSDDDIKDVISCVNTPATDELKDVVIWMTEYFPMEDIKDLLHSFDGYFPQIYPKNETCVLLGLWKTLYDRAEYKLLIENGKLDMVEENPGYQAKVALLQYDFDKYAPKFLNEKDACCILEIKDGYKYLIDNGYADMVLSSYKRVMLSSMEVVEYCIEKGLSDLVYNKSLLLRDTLLSLGEYSPFVKKHDSSDEFLLKYPSHVDWEDLYNYLSDDGEKKALIEKAKRNIKIPNCRAFVRRHSFWKKLWC